MEQVDNYLGHCEWKPLDGRVAGRAEEITSLAVQHQTAQLLYVICAGITDEHDLAEVFHYKVDICTWSCFPVECSSWDMLCTYV